MSRKPCEEQRKMLCSLITGQITCGNWAKCSYLFLFLTPCVFFFYSVWRTCALEVPWGRRMGQPFGDGAPALQSGPYSCWEALSCSPPASSQQQGEYETCSSFSCSAGVRDHHKAIKKNLFCEPCPKEAHQRLSCQNSQGQESPPPLSLIWKDLVVCLLMCSVWLSGY